MRACENLRVESFSNIEKLLSEKQYTREIMQNYTSEGNRKCYRILQV